MYIPVCIPIVSELYAMIFNHVYDLLQAMETGKYLSYALQCKKCRFFDRADKKKSKTTKSSKAMESDMAVDMLHELKYKGIPCKHTYYQ